MTAYTLRRYTLVAPTVKNNGERSRYPQRVADALERAGFTGWTEYDTVGVWHGSREPGVTFEIYSADWRDDLRAGFVVDLDSESLAPATVPARTVRTEYLLGEIGRAAM